MVIEAERRSGSQPQPEFKKPKNLFDRILPSLPVDSKAKDSELASQTSRKSRKKINETFSQKTARLFDEFIDGFDLESDFYNSKSRKLRTIEKAEKGNFYLKEQPITKTLVEFITFFNASNLKIEGKENLKKAQELSGSGNIIFGLNHRSNFDAPALEYALNIPEFYEMKQKTIFLQGIKLDRNPAANVFLGGFKRIRVWPPTIDPKNSRERRTCAAINGESLIFSKKALEKGYNLAIFLEGGRSYDGTLKEGEPSIVHYFEQNPNGIIVPVSIVDTEKILPIGSFIPAPLPASLKFGEPIKIKDLNDMFSNLSNGEKRKAIINFIMKKIAINLPEKDRGAYSNQV